MSDKRLKVIHLLRATSGVDVSVRSIVDAVDPKKIESVVVHSPSHGEGPFLDRFGKPISSYLLKIDRNIRLVRDLRNTYSFLRIIKSESPDLVHAHSAKGGVIARAASLLAGVKVLHTPQAYSYLSSKPGIKRWFYLSIERIFRQFNSTLLACSQSELERGIREVGYNKQKALLFNNSIFDIRNSDLAVNNYPLPEEFICTIGRPSYQKNLRLMIEVLDRLRSLQPNAHLVILGFGRKEAGIYSLDEQIQSLGLQEHVSLIPWMSRRQVWPILKKASVYVSTARYEGLPYGIIEAMALQKACVVTDCDGNRDLVEDGKNGYVVSDHSVDRMANCIFALISDPAKRAEFERHSRLRFEKEFDLEKNIELLEEIYFNQIKS